MKKIAIFIFLFLTLTTASAQKRNTIPDVAEEVKEAISKYQFERAEDLLDTRISALKKKKQDTSAEEEQLAKLEQLQSKLEATERVTFIDSIIVDKDSFLSHYMIGTESGSIVNAKEYFKTTDCTDCTVFSNQLGNQIIFAQADKQGNPHLYMSHKVGSEWSPAEPLNGLNEDDSAQNFPFMLNDGATLYYAAVNEEDGLGGYDIYMTRYDSDDKAFLSPDNIGMPFNSPANDYMYVIDEFYNLGWFATDRNMPEDKVCIYTFIPNETRRIYNAEEMDEEKLARLALISSIRETWTNTDNVNAAMERKSMLMHSTADVLKHHDFDFIINDKITYTTLSDFRTEQGKTNAKWWMENSQDYRNMKEELNKLREKYAGVADNEKSQLAAQIRIMEGKVEQLYYSIREQEKIIRKAELNK